MVPVEVFYNGSFQKKLGPGVETVWLDEVDVYWSGDNTGYVLIEVLKVLPIFCLLEKTGRELTINIEREDPLASEVFEQMTTVVNQLKIIRTE